MHRLRFIQAGALGSLGRNGKRRERNTRAALLTKHVEFVERVDALGQHGVVSLAHDPLVVMLRAHVQGQGTADRNAAVGSPPGRLVHAQEPETSSSKVKGQNRNRASLSRIQTTPE